MLGSLSRRLSKDIEDDDGIAVYSQDNPPRCPLVHYPELMAPRPERGHWSHVRQSQRDSDLKLPEPKSHLNPRRLGHWGRLDLPLEPDEWLVSRVHVPWSICQVRHIVKWAM